MYFHGFGFSRGARCKAWPVTTMASAALRMPSMCSMPRSPGSPTVTGRFPNTSRNPRDWRECFPFFFFGGGVVLIGFSWATTTFILLNVFVVFSSFLLDVFLVFSSANTTTPFGCECQFLSGRSWSSRSVPMDSDGSAGADPRRPGSRSPRDAVGFL